jgi:hypothetical protein
MQTRSHVFILFCGTATSTAIVENAEKCAPTLCPETLLQCNIDNVVMRSETLLAEPAFESQAAATIAEGKWADRRASADLRAQTRRH